MQDGTKNQTPKALDALEAGDHVEICDSGSVSLRQVTRTTATQIVIEISPTYVRRFRKLDGEEVRAHSYGSIVVPSSGRIAELRQKTQSEADRHSEERKAEEAHRSTRLTGWLKAAEEATKEMPRLHFTLYMARETLEQLEENIRAGGERLREMGHQVERDIAGGHYARLGHQTMPDLTRASGAYEARTDGAHYLLQIAAEAVGCDEQEFRPWGLLPDERELEVLQWLAGQGTPQNAIEPDAIPVVESLRKKGLLEQSVPLKPTPAGLWELEHYPQGRKRPTSPCDTEVR